MRKTDGLYEAEGRLLPPEALLDAVRKGDDERGGRFLLSSSEAAKLDELFSRFVKAPSCEGLCFMASSHELFQYLAETGDEELLGLVASSLGLMSAEEQAELIRQENSSSSAYRNYWMDLSREVLTSEGFDDFRFGAVKRDRNGCYLYDDEKAVLYVEVSRDGGDKRDALISFTLLGNPEAIESEEQNREFEWCCYFDDLLSAEENPLFLGGLLRTIDPFGQSSVTWRRYDIRYPETDAVSLGLIIKEAVRLMSMYPPVL